MGLIRFRPLGPGRDVLPIYGTLIKCIACLLHILYYCNLTMRKIVSIGTALLIFLQSINLHFNDIVELDKFVEHYQFHVDQHGDDLLTFISKHYGDEKDSHSLAYQEEQKEHEELPFQHQYQGYQVLGLVLGSVPLIQLRKEFPMDPKRNFHYHISYTPIWGDGLFQPPKQA